MEASTQDEADWEMRIDWVAAQSTRVFAGKPGYSGEWLCTPDPSLDAHRFRQWRREMDSPGSGNPGQD
jgi:hypothetical protein